MTPQTMKKKLTLPKLGTVSDYRHLWMLSFWILYLILYVVVEHAVTTDYWVSYLPLDDKIPFCEYFIVPYCMWHPLLFLMTVYLAFYDVETFRKYMWFVLAGLVSAIVVCWIFPNGQDLRPPSSRGTTSLPGWSAASMPPTRIPTSARACMSSAAWALSRPAVNRRGCAGGICSGS